MPANTPPANDPILERVAQFLVDLINGINAEQVANGGFYFSGYQATRPHPSLDLSAIVDQRVQVVQGLGELSEEASSTCSLVTREYFTFRADAVVAQRGTDSLDRKLNLIRADLIKRVMKDRQLGGIALTTDFAYAEIDDEVSDLWQGRVDIVFIITLQQSWLDPTTF